MKRIFLFLIMLSAFFCAPAICFSAAVNDVVPLVKDDKYEENDTMENAYTGLSSNVWLSAVDGDPILNDEDWYRIDVPDTAYCRIKVDCLFSNADCDIDMALYNSSSNVVAERLTVTDNEYLDEIVPATGSYYLKIWTRSDYKGSVYDLRWEYFSEDSYEPNSILSDAFTGLTEGTLLSLTDGLGYQNDDDWFEISVNDDVKRRVTAECTFSHSEGNIEISLYDSSNTQLYYKSTTTDNENIDCVVPSTGTYYIKVTSNNPDYVYTGNAYDLIWQTENYTPPELLSVSISGSDEIFEQDSAQYTCTATYSDGATSDVTSETVWSVDNTQYASVSSSGELTAEEVSSDQSVVITAVFGEKSATQDVLIKDRPLTVLSLVIEGPSEVDENSTATYTCTALWNDLSESDVTASAAWNTESSYAVINGGVLETSNVSMDEEITITADYGGEHIYKKITVVAYSAESVGYSFWTFQQEIPSELSDYEDTPANDGIPNLLKYACGLTALETCSSADLVTIVKDTSGSMFSIVYPRDESAVEVELQVIWASTPAGPWNVIGTDGTTTEFISQEGDIQQWKASVPISGEKAFMRLRALPLDPVVM
ncbi:MAG: T9SS type A sorting domain-containing protein [Kiritimatiellia bacterium]